MSKAPWEKDTPDAPQPPVTEEQPPVTDVTEEQPPIAEASKPVPTQLGAAIAPNPITDSEVPDEPEAQPVEEVTVTVPKAFKLRTDHHQLFEIKAGIQQMRRDLAESWYAKANGVQIYEP